MEELKIVLQSDTSELTVDMHQTSTDKSIVDVLKKENARVYQDADYRAFLVCEKLDELKDFVLRINNETISRDLTRSGEILMNLFGFNKLFSMSYGYVQLQINFAINDDYFSFESNYLPVMVRKSIQNDSVRRMTDFILKNNAMLLEDHIKSSTAETQISKNNKTIENKLALLQKIIAVLEGNYSYFRINSRYRTEHAERVDYFDKLQYVSRSTIQYVAQHPDELKRTNTNTGIIINGQRYQPERTLITQNSINYNTEENRAIKSFIDLLCVDTENLRNEVKTLISNNEYDSFEEENYISSTYYVYVNTLDILRSMEQTLIQYQKRILAIQLAYHGIFTFPCERMRNIPKPTAVFMAVPQYRQVYDCMFEWIKCSNVGLQVHNQILGLKKMNEIYELYVLLKLIRYFTDIGYTISRRERSVYEFTKRTMYQNTKHCNQFHFVRENDSVTLFYQPVIYCNTAGLRHGIGLYRNNTIKVNRNEYEAYDGGEYYTPDYIIKYENLKSQEVKYFILDAKYSNIKNVLRYQITDMTFKYLFSISSINPKDEIIGLYIINGQSENMEDCKTNIYDRMLADHTIRPLAEIVTLTENSMDNKENHLKLFNSSFGKYI